MSLLVLPGQTLTLQTFTDDYNRADSTSIGGNYRMEFNSMQIATNRLQNRTLPSNTARSGSWATVVSSASHNGGRLGTDNWTLLAQLIAPIGGLANDNYTGIGMEMTDAGPGSGTVLVYFLVSTGSGCRIMTYQMTGGFSGTGQASGLSGQTQQLTSATNATTTSVVRLDRRMYTATASIFSLTVGGTVIGQWNDSTGLVPAGNVRNRRWFVVTESNSPIFQGTYFSVAIDTVQVFDTQY